MPRLQLSVRGLMLAVLVCGLLSWPLAFVVGRALESRSDASCSANLIAIGVAMRQFHDKYGHFPPAFVADAQGRPALSWRVLLLEFLDPALWQEFDFREPWDGLRNRTLIARMPRVYACPIRQDQHNAGFTSYVVIKGPETAFPGDKAETLGNIRPASSGVPVILVAEVGNMEIPWTEPTDLRFDQMSFTINDPTRPCLSGPHRSGPGVLCADGRTRHISPTVAWPNLQAMISNAKNIGICTDPY